MNVPTVPVCMIPTIKLDNRPEAKNGPVPIDW